MSDACNKESECSLLLSYYYFVHFLPHFIAFSLFQYPSMINTKTLAYKMDMLASRNISP